jgi:hypothetical protein
MQAVLKTERVVDGRGYSESKSRGKSKGENLHGDTAQPNEQNLKERLMVIWARGYKPNQNLKERL